MKRTFTFLALFGALLFAGNLCAQAPAWQSLTTFGSAGNENVRGSCVDRSGNTYVVGHFSTVFSFASGVTMPLVGGTDVFIVKLNSAGVPQWANSLGSIGTEAVGGVVADDNGVYIIGNFSGTCSFGGSFSKVTVGSTDAYVAKLNPASGAFQWVTTFGGSGVETGAAICLDGSDGVYVTGTFSGVSPTTVISGPASTITISPTSGNSGDIFVAKFNRSTGYCNWWSQPTSSTAAEQGKSICYTRKNIVVTGNYAGAAVIGGQALPTAAGTDLLVATLDTANGNWTGVRYASSAMTNGTDVAIGCTYDAASDGTFITGYFGNGSASSGAATTISFDGNTITTTGGVNIDDIFVTRFDHTTNTFKWARNYGGVQFERAVGIHADQWGGIFVYGYHNNTSMTIGSTTLTSGSPSPNTKQSPLVFKITANDGTPLWAADGVVSNAVNFANSPYGLGSYTVGNSRTVTMSGQYQPSLQFGSLATIYSTGNNPSIAGDVFVTKLLDNNTCFTDISLQGNGVTIVDEDATPSTTDHTDFGSASTGATVTRTYTIRNTGLASLIVSSIGISGANAALFAASGLTLPATISAGLSTTFTVTYSPAAAGTHTATITVNSNDCAEGTYSFAVKGEATSGTPLSAAQWSSNVSCYGGCNGIASVNVSGGVPPYTYSWSPSGGISATATGLCANMYSCTITDNAGAQIVKHFTIIQPSPLSSSVVTNNAACLGVNNGSATILAWGGTSGYTYLWAPTGDTTAAATGLAAGVYSVWITDANGCEKNQLVNIGINAPTQPGAVAGLPGNGSVSQTQSVSIASGTYTDGGCNYITTVQPSGANPVSGSITTTVWVENAVPLNGIVPYVARHYQVTPANNPSTATGKVTLYFLQQEFDDYNNAPGSVLNLPAHPADLTGIANLRVTKYAGSSADNSGTPSSYSNGYIVINPNDYDILWNPIAQRWEVSFDVAGFSGFIVHANTFTLPVTWASFTATRSDNKVVLTWQTASEQNNSHFIVEYSRDGRNFASIGLVNAVGNSSNVTSYNFVHNQPVPQANYYRIMQVDHDGTKTYSGIRMVDLSTKASILAVLVNPVRQGKLQVQISRAGETTIYNNKGQLIKKQFLTAGTHTVDLGSPAAGIYLLKMGGETKKFIVD